MYPKDGSNICQNWIQKKVENMPELDTKEGSKYAQIQPKRRSVSGE